MNYKEMNAIGIVRLMLTDGVITEEIAGKYFPELKESEDEKIRKAIYNCVKWFGFDSCYFKDVSQEKCLAWLEKQGEQKPIDPDTLIEQRLDALTNIVAEQKSNDKVQPKFRVGDIIRHKEQGFTCKIIAVDTEYRLSECNWNGSHLPFDSQDAYELVEQKPTWSEEDEIKIKSITALLKSPALCAMDGNKGIIDESIKYLKALKERVQPKQEWSEEDEEIRDNIIRDLKRLSGDMVSPNQTYQKEIQWLKSLSPKN